MLERGQVAIWIILGVAIVGAAVVAYLFFPNIESAIRGQTSPNSALQTCLEPAIQRSVQVLSTQGGSQHPEGYAEYKGGQVKYLCYQAQYYLPCTLQQPLLKAHYEQELGTMISAEAQSCVEQITAQYKDSGYSVDATPTKIRVDFIPNSMRVFVDTSIDLKKGDTNERIRSFTIQRPSQLYSLLMLSQSILQFEVAYGRIDSTTFMAYYPNLKIEQDRLSDDSKIYTITDVTTKESFRFASRSVAWPAGYGTDL